VPDCCLRRHSPPAEPQCQQSSPCAELTSEFPLRQPSLLLLLGWPRAPLVAKYFEGFGICYKDRGGPAQLGIRDWAGLKGHIDDRNLACSLASEGRSEAPRGRLGAAQTGTVLSFLLVMCNFRPFGLNASRCISLVRVCSGHWKFVALWHFELPHGSHIEQIRSIFLRQFVLLCPVGSIAPLHFVRAFVLTAFEAPSVSEG